MSQQYRQNPRKSLTTLAIVAAAMFGVAGCEERPSADATDPNVEQQTDRTGAIEGTTPPADTEIDQDPTPQTSTGGAIPETDEGSSR